MVLSVKDIPIVTYELGKNIKSTVTFVNSGLKVAQLTGIISSSPKFIHFSSYGQTIGVGFLYNKKYYTDYFGRLSEDSTNIVMGNGDEDSNLLVDIDSINNVRFLEPTAYDNVYDGKAVVAEVMTNNPVQLYLLVNGLYTKLTEDYIVPIDGKVTISFVIDYNFFNITTKANIAVRTEGTSDFILLPLRCNTVVLNPNYTDIVSDVEYTIAVQTVYNTLFKSYSSINGLVVGPETITDTDISTFIPVSLSYEDLGYQTSVENVIRDLYSGEVNGFGPYAYTIYGEFTNLSFTDTSIYYATDFTVICDTLKIKNAIVKLVRNDGVVLYKSTVDTEESNRLGYIGDTINLVDPSATIDTNAVLSLTSVNSTAYFEQGFLLKPKPKLTVIGDVDTVYADSLNEITCEVYGAEVLSITLTKNGLNTVVYSQNINYGTTKASFTVSSVDYPFGSLVDMVISIDTGVEVVFNNLVVSRASDYVGSLNSEVVLSEYKSIRKVGIDSSVSSSVESNVRKQNLTTVIDVSSETDI